MVKKTKVELTIDASAERVFSVIGDCDAYSKVVPNIAKIEMLSGVTRGVGTRFRETRIMKGKEKSAILEVTEYSENHKVRFISDEGGTVWDNLFLLTEEYGKTHLELNMAAKPYKLLAKLVVPLIGGVVKKAVESDMRAVKEYCER